MLARLDLTGSPWDRGRAQAEGCDPATVRRVTVARVEAARAEGVINADALDYVAAQERLHREIDPEGMAEVEGIATGFGFAFSDLFLHLHLGTLRDLKGGARIEEGCSAWAVAQGPEGPLVVKNRDLALDGEVPQTIVTHRGADLRAGDVLALGSGGSPGAYSSGINARGLALADTQVPVSRHRVGWLRYLLMTRLLARCATVTEALALIRSHPHAGGGTLVMADATGAVAAVELSANGPQVILGDLLWRTNHYVTPAASGETLAPGRDRIAGTSAARFALLSARLPARDWTAAQARRLMAAHEAEGAPLCQHRAEGQEGSATVSGAIYSCREGSLLLCATNPCLGEWQRYALGPQERAEGAEWRTINTI